MGVVANVAVNLDARKPLQALRDLVRSSKKVEEQLKRKNQVIRRVGVSYEKMARKGLNGFRDLEENAGKLGRRMQTLQGRVKLAVAAFALFKATQVGIRRVESERRIKLLARGYGEIAALQAAAAASAKRFKISQTEANQAIGNAYARLRPLGLSLDDIKSTFNGFNTAARLGGATSQEAAASFTQLSQALGSGALRGDEFRSISEQVPLILKAISDETGIAAGQLKEYAKEGKLTSDIVVKALRRIERDGADQLTEALGGPDAAIQEFRNATEDLSVALTTTIVPEVSTAFKELAKIIKDLEGPISFIGGLLGGALRQASKLIRRIRRGPKQVEAENAAADAARRQVPFLELGTPAGQRKFNEIYEKELARRLAIIDGAVPGQLPPSAADLPGTSTKTGPTSTLDPLKGKKDRSGRQRVDISEALFALEQKRQSLAFSTNELLKIEVERQIAVQKILESGLLPRERTIALQDANNAALERGAALLTPIIEGAQEIQQGARDAGKAFAELFIKSDKAAKELQEKFGAIGQQISTSIVDALTSAVDSTKSLADVATDLLRNIGRLLLQLGVNTALSATGLPIFGGLRGFANGGRPPVNKPSIVGERGPELFVPRSSGAIIPNDKMIGGSSNVVVNVDATGSKVEGDNNQASQLGKVIGAAVQAELVKQKRPGGLLAGV